MNVQEWCADSAVYEINTLLMPSMTKTDAPPQLICNIHAASCQLTIAKCTHAWEAAVMLRSQGVPTQTAVENKSANNNEEVVIEQALITTRKLLFTKLCLWRE